MGENADKVEGGAIFRDGEAALARIEVLVVRARAIWLSLIGFLAFIGLTLMGVQDIDFFSVDSSTTLPIVNIAIPTTTFFWTASLLAAVLHVYFHLFLLKLWDALAEAPPTIDVGRLGDRVFPWLVIDWALRKRPDRPSTRRPLHLLGTAVSGLIIWLSTPIALTGFWWRSLVAHDARLSLAIATALVVSLYATTESWRCARMRLSWPGIDNSLDSARRPFRWRWAYSLGEAWRSVTLVVIIGIVPASLVGAGAHHMPGWIEAMLAKWMPAEKPNWNYVQPFPETSPPLARAQLIGKSIARRPVNWRDHEVAKREYRIRWCGRFKFPRSVCEMSDDAYHLSARKSWCLEQDILECSAWFARIQKDFNRDWQVDRKAEIDNIIGPDLRDRDLRFADAGKAYAVGIDLRGARLEGANLQEAELEAANLQDARLDGAILFRARMEGANLGDARFQNTILSEARLTRAILTSAQLNRAYLGSTNFEGAFMTGVQLAGAHLASARFNRAYLGRAVLDGADIRYAVLDGAILRDADLTGADLRHARLEGASLRGAMAMSTRWANASIRLSMVHGVDFRFAKGLTQEQLVDVIGDEKTRLPMDAYGNRLHVWSCWRQPEAQRVVEIWVDRQESAADDIRKRGWVCAEGEEPQPVIPSPQSLGR